MLPAASRDFDFSDEAPSAAAGDTGVGTDVGTGIGIVVGAIAAPGGRKGLLRGSGGEKIAYAARLAREADMREVVWWFEKGWQVQRRQYPRRPMPYQRHHQRHLAWNTPDPGCAVTN